MEKEPTEFGKGVKYGVGNYYPMKGIKGKDEKYVGLCYLILQVCLLLYHAINQVYDEFCIEWKGILFEWKLRVLVDKFASKVSFILPVDWRFN